ncbi:hypothetical protein V2J52_00195 [Georgenia sp. MJ173]|uniref:hypothetical protein n=1 Tax=Georgenia sunbinii TaxID=3117728 RepID=UPI002F269616
MADLVIPYAVLGALWLPTLTAPPPTRSSGWARSTPGPDRAAAVEAALRAVVGSETHVVDDADGGHRSVREVLDAVADQVVLDVGAVLPVPGRAAGVPGVALLDALEAEQCLLLRTEGGSWALVPQVEAFGTALEPGTLVRWQLSRLPFAERPVPTLLGLVGSLRQARQDIAAALHGALDTFTDLDLAPGGGDGAALAAQVLRSELPRGLLPPGLDGPRVEVVVRAARLLALAELAEDDDGGAVAAAQTGARARALAELRDVARGALAAASVQHPAHGD